MSEKESIKSKIETSFRAYLTPILITIVGFLIRDKLASFEDRLRPIEELIKNQAIISVRVDVLNDAVDRIQQIQNDMGSKVEKIYAKHEEEIEFPKSNKK
jgi:hypothetical protein